MSEIQKRNVPPRLLVQLSFARRRCVRDASVYFRSAVAALNVCIQSLLVLEVFEGGPGTPWPRTYPDKQSTLDSQPYTRLPAPNMCGPRCRSRIYSTRTPFVVCCAHASWSWHGRHGCEVEFKMVEARPF